jgi:hypothetical protein
MANMYSKFSSLKIGLVNTAKVIESLKFMKEHPEIKQGEIIEIEIDPNEHFLCHSVFICPVLKVDQKSFFA